MTSCTPYTAAQNIWQEKLDSVFIDPITGITLKNTEASSDVIVKSLSIVAIGLANGMVQATEAFPVWDADGVEHSVLAPDIVTLFGRYVRAWFAMWHTYYPDNTVCAGFAEAQDA